jgi:Protein of unknown function (DUF3311)
MTPVSETPAKPAARNRRWLFLLALPYLGLLFPHLYTRATPTLMGFPFFYWYQFAWVILVSAIMGIVYRKTKS